MNFVNDPKKNKRPEPKNVSPLNLGMDKEAFVSHFFSISILYQDYRKV